MTPNAALIMARQASVSAGERRRLRVREIKRMGRIGSWSLAHSEGTAPYLPLADAIYATHVAHSLRNQVYSLRCH